MKRVLSSGYSFEFCLLAILLSSYHLHAQCDSAYYSITSRSDQQNIEGITIGLSSASHAQKTRFTYKHVTGYHLGNENQTEEIGFTLSKPIKKIRIYGIAMNIMEFFVLKINNQRHVIKPFELVTPDPLYGQNCTLQKDGSIRLDTLVIQGDGSFIINYENPEGVTYVQVQDSIPYGQPDGAIFDIQLYMIPLCEKKPALDSLDSLQVFIPDVFTPNGDGKNEVFKPILTGDLEKFELIVMNRWGQTIYSSLDPNRGWSGENSESGLFFWICLYQGIGQPLQKRKGTVSLIR